MTNYLLQILTGITTGAILFLVASGLTLVFGSLRIVNFAHGSLYMIGGYLVTSLARTIGFGNGMFWISVTLAALGVAALGVVIEVLILRRIYGRSLLIQMMVTFALIGIIGGIAKAIWGSTALSIDPPPFLSGAVPILGQRFPTYSLFLILSGGLAAAVLGFMLYRTSLGRMIRAAVSDRE